MNRFEKVGCAAVPDVVEYSAIKSAIICCRELIQELAYGKTNSVNEEQLSDYHYRLMYWNEVEDLLINEQKDNRSVANPMPKDQNDDKQI